MKILDRVTKKLNFQKLKEYKMFEINLNISRNKL